jgi:hypothetical protein
MDSDTLSDLELRLYCIKEMYPKAFITAIPDYNYIKKALANKVKVKCTHTITEMHQSNSPVPTYSTHNFEDSRFYDYLTDYMYSTACNRGLYIDFKNIKFDEKDQNLLTKFQVWKPELEAEIPIIISSYEISAYIIFNKDEEFDIPKEYAILLKAMENEALEVEASAPEITNTYKYPVGILDKYMYKYSKGRMDKLSMKVKHLYIEDEWPKKTVMKTLNISSRMFEKCLLYSVNQSPEFIINNINPSRRPKYTEEHVEYLIQCFSTSRGAIKPLKTLVSEINIKFPSNQISISQVRNIIKTLGLRKNKIKLKQANLNSFRNKANRYLVSKVIIQSISIGKTWISFDECWISEELKDTRGWFSKNSDRTLKEPIGRDFVYLLLAISIDGILGYQLRCKATNDSAFINFISRTMIEVSKAQGKAISDYLLFIDNLSAHKTLLARQVFTALGINVLFNAPYSVRETSK